MPAEIPFQRIVEIMNDGIWLLGADLRTIFVNERICSMMGYSENELMGESPLKFIAPELKAIFSEQLENRRLGQLGTYELKMIRKDGSDLWTRVSGTPIVGEDKQYQGAIAVHRDITEEKNYQLRLRQSESLFDRMAQSIGELFWMMSADGKEILYCSPAFESIFGFSQSKLTEDPSLWFKMVVSEDQANVLECRKQLMTTGSSQIHYRINRPDGQIRWLWGRGFLVPNDGGKQIICGVTSDITQQKKAEELIEVQRLQMLTATKMSALGEMAAGIAHEVNNPLAIIHLIASQMQDRIARGESLSEKELLEKTSRIEKTANRIAKIVSGLQTFSRNGENERIQNCLLKQIINDTLQLCSERFKNYEIKLSTQGLDSNLSLDCRPVQISQVILNLLNNSFTAIASTPQPWIKIELAKRGNSVEIRILDSGKGIPSEVSDRIFQPFFTTKELGQGTGLGLSISKGIIEAHAGTIDLEPQNLNTCFVIRLPIKSPNT